ncbi:HEPN domain-containing protein [Flavobacterium pectinovorum]|uniref:HEPN domain-containing protein n=1 Tax=Flavobacterium pectinovorum TaxID=29533 RepID=UPI00137649FE|nr:HEPN domain-containing protein [Flavobacterium pectinovorum]
MSFLKEKSNFNLDAAKILIDEHSCYAPSVHCSYYAVFQYISTTLNRLGETYEEISSTINNSRGQRNQLNSHDYPIKLMVNKVTEKSDTYYGNTVKNKIKELKTFRKIADYDNVQVTIDDSNKALSLGIEIVSLIKKKLS